MTPIDAHTFLRTRRSIRRFKTDPVPDSVLTNILETAAFAPSAHHRQPWRFVLVKGEKARQHLAAEMSTEYRQALLKDNVPADEIEKRLTKAREKIIHAPVVIMLCMDMGEMDVYPDKRRKKAEFLIATQSVANAGLQLLLAAHAEGLGGVWVCSPIFAQPVIQRALSLPADWEPQAMFLLGYPADVPQARERKPLQEVVKIFEIE